MNNMALPPRSHDLFSHDCNNHIQWLYLAAKGCKT
jgi:hypothetical protein